MRKTLITATTLVFALSGAAFAQSATGNMNNPGSVKSNSEKSMDNDAMKGGSMEKGAMKSDMPATTGTAPGAATTAPGGSMGTMPSNSGTAPAR